MPEPLSVSQQMIVVIVSGVLAQLLSSFARLPSILFLLTFGIALGPDGYGILRPDRFGPGLEVLVTLCVAIILFEGSMNLSARHVWKVHRPVRRLITEGLVITFGSGAAAAYLIFGLHLPMAALFGALVAVTGPTVIRPIVREGEGILIYPLGAVLAILCLEFALGRMDEPLGARREFSVRAGVRIAAGAAGGPLVALVLAGLRGRHWPLKNPTVPACVLGGYGAAESLRRDAGLRWSSRDCSPSSDFDPTNGN